MIATKTTTGVDGLDLSLHKFAFEEHELHDLATAEQQETLDCLSFDGTVDKQQSRSESNSPPASRTSGRRATIQEMADCLICDEEMNWADAAHPPQCVNACGFNFCNSCIQSLIKSSRDDYGLASDGNMHVKVFLFCPNCRSDLSSTIRDTVILRKADRIEKYGGKCDEELTESEQRMCNVIDDPELRDAIAEAKEREAKFFGRKYEKGGDEDGNDNHVTSSEEGMSPADQKVLPELGLVKASSGSKSGGDIENKKAVAIQNVDNVLNITGGTKRGARKRREKARDRSSVFVLIDETKKVRERKANLMKKEADSATTAETETTTGEIEPSVPSSAFCCFGF